MCEKGRAYHSTKTSKSILFLNIISYPATNHTRKFIDTLDNLQSMSGHLKSWSICKVEIFKDSFTLLYMCKPQIYTYTGTRHYTIDQLQESKPTKLYVEINKLWICETISQFNNWEFRDRRNLDLDFVWILLFRGRVLRDICKRKTQVNTTLLQLTEYCTYTAAYCTHNIHPSSSGKIGQGCLIKDNRLAFPVQEIKWLYRGY